MVERVEFDRQGMLQAMTSRHDITGPDAIAELIDNSIEGGASLIALQVTDGEVSVFDNGDGFNPADYLSIGRRGESKRRLEASRRIGRYGVGGKQASMILGAVTEIRSSYQGVCRAASIDWHMDMRVDREPEYAGDFVCERFGHRWVSQVTCRPPRRRIPNFDQVFRRYFPCIDLGEVQMGPVRSGKFKPYIEGSPRLDKEQSFRLTIYGRSVTVRAGIHDGRSHWDGIHYVRGPRCISFGSTPPIDIESGRRMSYRRLFCSVDLDMEDWEDHLDTNKLGLIQSDELLELESQVVNNLLKRGLFLVVESEEQAREREWFNEAFSFISSNGSKGSSKQSSGTTDEPVGGGVGDRDSREESPPSGRAPSRRSRSSDGPKTRVPFIEFACDTRGADEPLWIISQARRRGGLLATCNIDHPAWKVLDRDACAHVALSEIKAYLFSNDFGQFRQLDLFGDNEGVAGTIDRWRRCLVGEKA